MYLGLFTYPTAMFWKFEIEGLRIYKIAWCLFVDNANTQISYFIK